MRKFSLVPVLLAVVVLAVVPAHAGENADGVVATPAEGFVPVAIWELKREGFPAIRHAWVAGSEKMLRVSWDDGVTWHGFRPVHVDVARGLLAIKVATRDEVGRGEVAWRDKASLAVTTRIQGRATLPATAAGPEAELTITLIEVKEVAPSQLKACATKSAERAAAAGDPALDSEPGGGGPESCCISCYGMRVCDCSVCIVECHTSCCIGGCYCLSC